MTTVLTRTRDVGTPLPRTQTPRRLAPRMRALVRGAHVIVAIGWTGLVVAMLIVGVGAATTRDERAAALGYDLMERLAAVFIPVFAVATVFTGVVVSLGTAWGLTRHRWVITKVVLAGVVIATAAGLHSRWVGRAAQTGADPWLVVTGSATHLLLLVAATTLVGVGREMLTTSRVGGASATGPAPGLLHRDHRGCHQ